MVARLKRSSNLLFDYSNELYIIEGEKKGRMFSLRMRLITKQFLFLSSARQENHPKCEA